MWVRSVPGHVDQLLPHDLVIAGFGQVVGRQVVGVDLDVVGVNDCDVTELHRPAVQPDIGDAILVGVDILQPGDGLTIGRIAVADSCPSSLMPSS